MSAKNQLSSRIEWIRENYLKDRPEIERKYNESNNIAMLLQEIDTLCRFCDEVIAENDFYLSADSSEEATVKINGYDLKPCPICKGINLSHSNLTSIHCAGCYFTFTVYIASSFGMVASAWNKRNHVRAD